MPRGSSASTARPPIFRAASQAIWPGEEPVLVRNYDYNPHAFDRLVMHTSWQGRKVIGTVTGCGGWSTG